jgi:hypothetical protein
VTTNPNPTTPSPRRLVDLAPRRNAPTADAPSPTAPPQATAPITTPAGPKAATAMHSRIKPAVLDLRPSATPAPVAAAAPTVIQPATHIPAAPPKATTHERHLAQLSDRLNQAKQYDRSPHINKFAGNLATPVTATPSAIVHPAVPAPAAPTPAAPTGGELPRLAATHHEAMTRLVPPAAVNPTTAPAPAGPTPGPATAKPAWRPHLSLSPHTGRVAATTTAVVIMAGYIWLQNYPKFAIQAAGDKAGLSASLPGYIPSSYNLVSTDVAPGLVTLSYGSPSAQEPLKIAQHRTSWDSSSLLDNFVAKNADDYSTIQGQGLTIYVWGNNHATWVNHGVWYSIEGATRLSREQILKIAFSL